MLNYAAQPYKVTGHLAGLVYLVLVLAGIFSLAYVPKQLIVSSDPALSITQISESIHVFRWAVAAEILCYLSFPVLVLLLFQLTEKTGRFLAMLMVLFVAVSVPISLLAMQDKLTILNLVSQRGIFEGIDPTLQSEIFSQSLASYYGKIKVASFLWGLWLMPLGLLILKNRMIPRVLGAFLILGGFGYVIKGFGGILAPDFPPSWLRPFLSLPSSIGELGTCAWLLIFGAKDHFKNDS